MDMFPDSGWETRMSTCLVWPSVRLASYPLRASWERAANSPARARAFWLGLATVMNPDPTAGPILEMGPADAGQLTAAYDPAPSSQLLQHRN